MKILNVHKRLISRPIAQVAPLLETLSTQQDKIWPYEKWPAMKFKDGLKLGSKGGHGPIRYTIDKYEPSKLIQFRFSKPDGLNGVHRFEIYSVEKDTTEIKHTIKMQTSGKGTLLWVLTIKWLHDALLEDSLDKVENHLLGTSKKSGWGIYVRFLRWLVKPRKR